MKKILCAILSAALISASAVPAFAAGASDNMETEVILKEGTYAPNQVVVQFKDSAIDTSTVPKKGTIESVGAGFGDMADASSSEQEALGAADEEADILSKGLGGDFTLEDTLVFDTPQANSKAGDSVGASANATGDGFSIALVSSDKYDTATLIEKLSKVKGIEKVEPNYYVQAEAFDDYSLNDEYSSYLYQANSPAAKNTGGDSVSDRGVDPETALSVNASSGWSKLSGNEEEAVVAIVDSGVLYTHEDLRDKMWVNPGNIGLKGRYGYNFAYNTEDPMDDVGHGTHCAGVITAKANNGYGVAGIASKANIKIMALKTLATGGLGVSTAYSNYGAFNYIHKAVLGGVNVVAVSNSWGGTSYSTIFDDLVPKVAMSEYGFTRFGTDKYITTKFYDPRNFENNRKTMKALYVENGSKESDYKADDFKVYGTPLKKMAPLVAELIACLPAGAYEIYSQIKDGSILVKDNTKANYDANIAAYLLLEQLTKEIGNRSEYCKKYQSGVSNFLLSLMNDVNALKKDELYDLLSKVLLSAAVSSVPGFGDLADKAIRKALPSDANANKIIDAIDPLLDVIGKVYWERPNELISLGVYIKEVFQTHDNGVNIAHLEAQDTYYVDAYNAKNGKNLSLAALRDNADFGRVTFKDYNDIGLFNSKGNTCFVSVKGEKAVKSEIKKCSDGFAVGYYSYATEEGMELFMPVNQKYILNMKGFSVKLYHTVNYSAFYQAVGPNSKNIYRSDRGHDSDWFCGNTDFNQTGLNMNY